MISRNDPRQGIFNFYVVVFVSATECIVKRIIIHSENRRQKQILKVVVPGTLGLFFLASGS